jgi:hypothetical protein
MPRDSFMARPWDVGPASCHVPVAGARTALDVPELPQLCWRRGQFQRARRELSEAADRDVSMLNRELPEAPARTHQRGQEQSSAPMSSAISVAVGWADRDANGEE